jgi:hypothetical protein
MCAFVYMWSNPKKANIWRHGWSKTRIRRLACRGVSREVRSSAEGIRSEFEQPELTNNNITLLMIAAVWPHRRKVTARDRYRSYVIFTIRSCSRWPKTTFSIPRRWRKLFKTIRPEKPWNCTLDLRRAVESSVFKLGLIV